ncbi:ketosynthase chain-length factor [Nonomuraea roseoviolacea]|uniref:Act minimal PKS chain-length factor (CLF/KS beta) n=1 Tax=Nonomuraea roseoviolacea subsp. carminata TaxID=160689 RepID=A0ABT1JS08_9ACTN|nr:ketosynthase chain-length factor [Nonomuraea roseoviolacea]MCP2344076.1 act minimal PKS chain-length factor (CLF/KS beta) [Nonomuraea roseoviolacea subsp. carminata]
MLDTDVVVTGVGVVAPVGLTPEEYWAALLSGRSGIRPLRRFDPARLPSPLAGEVEGFEPRDHLPARILPQTDLMTQYALYAADRAIAESGFEPASPLDVGVITASASGGFDFGQRELQHLWHDGPDHVSAFMSFAWFYAVNTGQISIRHDLRGPVGVMVTEQAGGLDAIAHARRKVARGTPMMVTGGMDSSLCPYGMAALTRWGRLSTAGDPAAAYLPFDRRAGGHVPGEGGAILTLEQGGAARARGARVYGRIAGYGASFDPPPGSGRPPALIRAVEAALADAGIAPADVALVIADAAADPGLDAEEARTLAAVFGPRGVPVTAPKTLTGRLYSGAAPLDVVTALLALREGVAPATANVRDVDPELPVDLVLGDPRPITGDAALVVARGAGGFNSAMVVRR